MKTMNSIVSAAASLLLVGAALGASAQVVTATQGGRTTDPNTQLLIPSDVLSTIFLKTGPRTPIANNDKFLDVEGASSGSFAADGFTRFDLTNAKSYLSAYYGGSYTITGVSLQLTHSDAAFSTPGNIIVGYTADDSSDIRNTATPAYMYPIAPTAYETLTSFYFPDKGNVGTGTIDTVNLLSAPANATNDNTKPNPSNVTASGTADLLTKLNAAGTTVSLILAPDDTLTPGVAGTWEGDSGFFNTTTMKSLPAPVLVLTAAPGANSVYGTIVLDGAADITAVNAAAPVGTFTADFRNPATGASQFTKTFTLAAPGNFITPTAGSFFITDVTPGTYNVSIKSDKGLSTLVAGVTVGAAAGNLGTVTILGGDADNSNTVNFDDFLVLLNAFGSVAPGADYDPTADFTYDGQVNFDDFLVLLNNFGASGQ